MVVTFEEFTDREHVLRKAGLLKGSNIHVTEDMSRCGYCIWYLHLTIDNIYTSLYILFTLHITVDNIYNSP